MYLVLKMSKYQQVSALFNEAPVVRPYEGKGVLGQQVGQQFGYPLYFMKPRMINRETN